MMYDVVIAGAGPVGLLLACELRLAGCSVLVLEKAADPDSAFKRLPFGMRGLSVPSVEALDRRGLLDALIALERDREAFDGGGMAAATHWKPSHRPGGHFAGIQFFHDAIDPARWSYRLPSPAGAGMLVTMASLETLLAARAGALGVTIHRGKGVDGIEQYPDHVAVRAGDTAVRGRWLVGCDGGRSTVRKIAGFDFRGTEPEFPAYSLAVVLDDPASLPPGRHYTPTGMYTFAPPGTLSLASFDGGVLHRAGAVTRDHAQDVLRHISGTGVGIAELRLATTWTDRAYQADGYRRGRVLLAGDAAHVHSPLGGQGLNLGLGDAMNLGWKLAAMLRGDRSEALLDSYTAERHPVGARVLDWSRAQVALMRPSPSSRALAAIVRDLVATGDGATYFAERVWGVTLRYELGQAHPLVGRSVPDFHFADGSRLAEHLREGRGLLLSFDHDARLAGLASGCDGRLAYLGCDVDDPLGLRALLVRPDGIVAWASDGDIVVDELADAVSRWFSATGVPPAMACG